MYSALQKQIRPQALATLLVSLIFLTGIASYLYVLKQPFHDLRQAQQKLEILETEMQTGIPLDGQIRLIQGNIEALHQQLNSSGQKLPLNQTIAFVIAQMDKIAATHGVKLASVEPGEVEKVFLFHEVPFRVEVTGNYFHLFDWLNQVERDLGPIVVKEFELKPEPELTTRRFILTLVSYQFAEN
jgi:Tfp pilus assembly protein PilO